MYSAEVLWLRTCLSWTCPRGIYSGFAETSLRVKEAGALVAASDRCMRALCKLETKHYRASEMRRWQRPRIEVLTVLL
jgi:hypothetical protein